MRSETKPEQPFGGEKHGCMSRSEWSACTNGTLPPPAAVNDSWRGTWRIDGESSKDDGRQPTIGKCGDARPDGMGQSRLVRGRTAIHERANLSPAARRANRELRALK